MYYGSCANGECYEKKFRHILGLKIEFRSLRREMLLFLTTNMAAVTSHANQQLFLEIFTSPLLASKPAFRSINFELVIAILCSGYFFQIKPLAGNYLTFSIPYPPGLNL